MGGTWPLVNVQYVSDVIFCIVTFGNEFTTLEFGFKEIVVLSLRSEQPFGVKLGVPSPSDHGAPEHLPWVSGLMSQKKPTCKATFTWLHPLSHHLLLRPSTEALREYRHKKQRNKCGWGKRQLLRPTECQALSQTVPMWVFIQSSQQFCEPQSTQLQNRGDNTS